MKTIRCNECQHYVPNLIWPAIGKCKYQKDHVWETSLKPTCAHSTRKLYEKPTNIRVWLQPAC
jgi:hypothetical protein